MTIHPIPPRLGYPTLVANHHHLMINPASSTAIDLAIRYLFIPQFFVQEIPPLVLLCVTDGHRVARYFLHSTGVACILSIYRTATVGEFSCIGLEGKGIR
jgi:hypothetical protein